MPGEALFIRNLLTFYLRLLRALPNRWWPLPLRLIVGYGFMEHGYAKLARGPDSFTHILQALHMRLGDHFDRAPRPAASFLGGLAFLAGTLVPLVSVPMAIVLVVAIVSVHLPNGFSSIKLQAITTAGPHFGQPGYETDLLYLASLAALVLGGSGPFAFDTWLKRRQKMITG